MYRAGHSLRYERGRMKLPQTSSVSATPLNAHPQAAMSASCRPLIGLPIASSRLDTNARLDCEEGNGQDSERNDVARIELPRSPRSWRGRPPGRCRRVPRWGARRHPATPSAAAHRWARSARWDQTRGASLRRPRRTRGANGRGDHLIADGRAHRRWRRRLPGPLGGTRRRRLRRRSRLTGHDLRRGTAQRAVPEGPDFRVADAGLSNGDRAAVLREAVCVAAFADGMEAPGIALRYDQRVALATIRDGAGDEDEPLARQVPDAVDMGAGDSRRGAATCAGRRSRNKCRGRSIARRDIVPSWV